MNIIDRTVERIRHWLFSSERIIPVELPRLDEDEELELISKMRDSTQVMQSSTSSLERAAKNMLAMIEGRRREHEIKRTG